MMATEAAFEAFARSYWEFAAAYPANLVGHADFPAFRDEGIAPALRAGGHLPASGALLDIGSGGGLPGLVFARLAPGLAVHLLEPRRKRWVFLREAAAALGLPNVVAHLGQWPGHRFSPAPPPFDRVSIRGLKLTPAMVTALRPLLAPDARFMVFHEDNAGVLAQAGLAFDKF